MKRAASAALAAALLVVAGGVSAEGARIYKWVDENGIAHYTTDPDRIPSSIRDRVRALERAAPPPAAAEGATPRAPVAENEPGPGTLHHIDQILIPEPAAPAAVPPTRPGASAAAGMGANPAALAAPSGAAPGAPTAGAPPGATGSEAWAVSESAALPVRTSGLHPSPQEMADLDREIDAVEAQIAEQEEALIGMVSAAGDQNALADDPSFREIAQRLPKLEAQLNELRERRAQIEALPSATQ
jgi:Domain of unknown function (DUF4124)